MKLTGRELHEWIEEYIPDFEDADLFHSEEVLEVADSTWRRLEEAQSLGYLSIDSPSGHEMYHCSLE